MFYSWLQGRPKVDDGLDLLMLKTPELHTHLRCVGYSLLLHVPRHDTTTSKTLPPPPSAASEVKTRTWQLLWRHVQSAGQVTIARAFSNIRQLARVYRPVSRHRNSRYSFPMIGKIQLDVASWTTFNRFTFVCDRFTCHANKCSTDWSKKVGKNTKTYEIAPTKLKTKSPHVNLKDDENW